MNKKQELIENRNILLFQGRELYEMLEERLIRLKEIEQTMTRNLEKYIEFEKSAYLHGIVSNGRKQYYIRDKSGKEKYIRKDEMPKYIRMPQCEYEMKMLESVSNEIKALEYAIKGGKKFRAEEIYESMSPAKQVMVQPIFPGKEQMVESFLNIEYEKMGFAPNEPEHYAGNGTRVRSKSEIIIYDSLKGANKVFHYEFPLYLKEFGIVHPDFYILNTKTRKIWVWEHLGMLSLEDYRDKNIRKIRAYENNGFFLGDGLIITAETQNVPLNRKQVENYIARYL